MRVISGSAKGHRLIAPRGQRVRPALDKVKEAIFNILFNVEGMRVFDLFAGSGSIGIEALSRGAASAVFVEEWGEAIATIERNLRHCRLEGRANVIKCPVESAIKRLCRKDAQFDLVFVDPPYLKGFVNPTLNLLSRSTILADGATIVVEHHPKEPLLVPPGLSLTDCRKYGQTRVSFLVARHASHVTC